MSDSNLALMYKLDTLPTAGAKSNYQPEIADMTESVNKNIDETQKGIDAHFDQLIKIYNHQHEKASKRPAELVKMLRQGKEDVEEIKEWHKSHKAYTKYSKRLQDQRANHENIYGGDAWEHYERKGEFDPEVLSEINAKEDRLNIKATAIDYGGQIREANPYEANELILGPDQAYEKENAFYEDIDSLLVHHESSYRPRAEAGMKVHIPGQFTPDGSKIYKTYEEAIDSAEKRYISDVIDSWYAYKHEDIAGGRFGLWKKDFINKLIDRDKARIKKELETDSAALKEIQQENRAKDLKIKIKRDPGYLITYLNTYKGLHGGKYNLARQEAFDTLIRGVQTGVLTREDIQPVLDHKFLAHDSTPQNPHIVTARSYWKKDTRRLLKAVSNAEKSEFEETQANREAAMNTRASDIVAALDANDAPITYTSVSNIQKKYMQEFGLRDPELLPDIIKNLPYDGMIDDVALDQELTWRHYTLNQQITPHDLRGFIDPDLHKKWNQVVKSEVGLSQAATSRRNNAISAEVTARTLESDVNKARTPKWTSNYEQAIREYDAVYNKALENNASDLDAHREALSAVKDGLWKEVSPGVYQWDNRQASTYDPSPTRQINTVALAIAKDRNVIYSSQPWEGEEPHLAEAAEYMAKSRKGRRVAQPEFYRQLARRIGANTERLIADRLIATGAAKENEIEIPEEKNLSVDHQKLLLKPSGSKTYRVTQENEDLVWMLDTVASPTAEANGGYTAIRNPNGQYVNIEDILGKPLNEVVAGDVLQLINEGYTNIGRYDITPEAYMSIFLTNGLTGDIPFDEKGQDLVVLSRLRQKAQAANSYAVLNSRYRRLVNIPEEDHQRFLETVGELPTWLRLDTLLPEAAKELVRSTLTQE